MIPINKPIIGKEEIEAVKKVLESGILTNASPAGGPMVKAFEEAFANYIGVRYAIAVNSGTAALYAALLALNIKPGDEIIVPAFTFVATANAVLQVGAKPVFVDIDPKTYTMDPDDLRKRITDKTKAIIPVHLYGLPADMDPIMEIAEEYSIFIIEDAAQAHGSEYKGSKTGSLGHLGCFSFYPSKVITTGEGGMITTNNDELAKRLKMIRTHGQVKGYDSVILGANLRMPEMEAAIGLVQLKKLEKFLALRRRNALTLTELLAELETLQLPTEPPDRKHNWYLYTISVNPTVRDKILNYLRSVGIGATVYYPTPIHKIPLYASLGYSSLKLPHCEKATKSVMSLPVHPQVGEKEIEFIAKALKKSLTGA